MDLRDIFFLFWFSILLEGF
uniref:Uncharacterized protein n=1 Tax=Rhizophora mucronata TaxID=61149 RepID=A0A2P2QX21_RHIMU